MGVVLKSIGNFFYWTGLLVIGLWWLFREGLPSAWEWIRGQKKAPSTHGDASFASLNDLKKDGHLAPGGFLYGIQEGKRVFGLRESCVHFFGKRGEGKSATHGANIRYKAQLPVKNHMLINDPKGEHHANHGSYLESHGYDLLVLDLVHPERSTFRGVPTQYNPVMAFANSTQVSLQGDIESLTELLITEEDEDKGSRHFIDAAHAVTAGLIDWHYSQNPECDLSETIRLLTTASEAERDRVFEQIQRSGSDTAKAGVNIFMRVKEREKGSFNSTLGRKLRIFNAGAVREIMRTRGPSWTWEDVLYNAKPVAIILKSGLGSVNISGPFARIVIGQCIDAVIRHNNEHGTRLPTAMDVFADEAPKLGYCKPLHFAITELRSAGLNVFMNWQSPGQIRHIYGAKAQEVLDGCDWIVPGGLKDVKLLTEVKTLMGDYTAQSQSSSKAEHGESEGKHETARALQKESEIKSRERGQAIVLADRRTIAVKLPFIKEADSLRYL